MKTITMDLEEYESLVLTLAECRESFAKYREQIRNKYGACINKEILEIATSYPPE